jgi:hypothetical protein
MVRDDGSFVLRYARRTDNGRRGSARPTQFFWAASGYTSFHRAGFSMFYLRGKTYGNVFGAKHYRLVESRLKSGEKWVEKSV